MALIGQSYLSRSKSLTWNSFLYIYIFFAFALDESVILNVLQFPI